MRASIHQVKINFHVTPEVQRYVYVYIIEARYCYLIDSGVYGCEKEIVSYLEKIGRRASDIKGIFLTHAHPDHIGSCAWFQEHTDCKVYASEGEKRWIENIDLQFQERPIPNFYAIAGRSSKVDVIVKDQDVLVPEEGLMLEAVRTAGHSMDEISYRMGENMFIGDAVPVKGDIPIMVDEMEQRYTIQKLEHITGVQTYYPAWDTIYSRETMQKKLADAHALISTLKAAVMTLDCGEALPVLVDKVCNELHQNGWKGNPLFATTIDCLRERC